MIINSGKIYVHADGGRYRVIRLGFKMKDSALEWVKAVMYEPAEYGPDKDYGNGDVYVRSQKDFCARFTAETKP